MQDINTRSIGMEVEATAREFLEKQGLKHRDSNYECKTGEIDIIMEDAETIVFVEVRFRQNKNYGGALVSVSRSKQTKIIRTAKLYLLEHNLYDKVFCRFDIITGETVNNQLEINWYKNAFTENFI